MWQNVAREDVFIHTRTYISCIMSRRLNLPINHGGVNIVVTDLWRWHKRSAWWTAVVESAHCRCRPPHPCLSEHHWALECHSQTPPAQKSVVNAEIMSAIWIYRTQGCEYDNMLKSRHNWNWDKSKFTWFALNLHCFVFSHYLCSFFGNYYYYFITLIHQIKKQEQCNVWHDVNQIFFDVPPRICQLL